MAREIVAVSPVAEYLLMHGACCMKNLAHFFPHRNHRTSVLYDVMTEILLMCPVSHGRCAFQRAMPWHQLARYSTSLSLMCLAAR